MATLIFDYDGTLHNTKKLYGSSFRIAYNMLVEKGYAPAHEYSDDDVAKYLGVSAPDMWRDFMPELQSEIKKKASRIIGQEMINGVNEGRASLFEGVTESLDNLKSEGYRLVILSNCHDSYMEAHRIVLKLDRWFDGYFCAENYGFIPKEDIFPDIRKRFPDSNYIMIGDRGSDFRVGTVNGIPTIGCLYGFGTDEERKLCTLTVSSPSEWKSAAQTILNVVGRRPPNLPAEALPLHPASL